jgi:methylamine dehydrogenase accessory protein MauD
MTGGLWVFSYVLLWLAVLGLSVMVVALLRQVGVLHTRLRPLGVHFAGEGPERLVPAPPIPDVDYARAAMTLVAFSSPTCEVCHALLPSLRAMERQYRDLALVEVELDDRSQPVFSAFNVRSTPYVVTVDRQGIVQGRGVANSLEQVEVLVEEGLASA